MFSNCCLVKATSVKNQLYGRVRQLVEKALINPQNGRLKEQFEHYLIIRKSEKQESEYTINIREDVIAHELANAGWLATVSNHIQDAAEAIRIYRDKDVVEKGLYKTMTMKNLIRTMKKLRTQVIDGRRILFPLIRRQKDIYKAFAVLPLV